MLLEVLVRVDRYSIINYTPNNQIAKDKPSTYPKLKIKFPSIGLVEIHLVEPKYKLSFEVCDNIELLFSMIVA